MKLSELIEAKWYEFDKPITLFHGTSSHLIDKILENGLQPPDSILKYANIVLKHYGINPNSSLGREAKASTVNFRHNRTDANGNPMGTALFFFAEMDRAAGYAQSYAKHGGEIAYEIYSHLKRVRGMNIDPRYISATPVVVEVTIPREWIIVHEPFENIYNRMKQNNALDKLDKIGHMIEIRVGKSISAEFITNVHYINE